jgi:site-specific DNA recombinase
MGGQTLNTASAMGRMFLTMAAGFAELERNLVAERTAAAIRYKQTQHEYIGGDAPCGWEVATDDIHIQPNDAEQVVIKEAYALREQGMSLRKIGQELASKGLFPRSGKGWHAQSIKYLLEAEVA